MTSVAIDVCEATFFRRGLLQDARRPLNVTTDVTIGGRRGVLETKERDDAHSTGLTLPLGDRHVFSGVTPWGRVEVRFRDAASGSLLGLCVLSMRRLVRGVTRSVVCPIALPQDGDRPPTVSGSVRVSIYSEDLGAVDTRTGPHDALESHEYGERLARVLFAREPHLLPLVDIILAEGIEHAQAPEGPAAAWAGEEAFVATPVRQHYGSALAALGITHTPTAPVALAVTAAEGLISSVISVASRCLDPYIVVTGETQEFSTRPGIATNAPTYRDAECLFHVSHGECSTFTVAVYHRAGRDAAADPLLGTGTLSLRTVACDRPCSRRVPLLTPDGRFGGTVLVEIHTADVGEAHSDHDEAAVCALQRRVEALLVRYDPSRLAHFDDLVAAGLYDPEACMAALIDAYGLEPGTNALAVGIGRITGLLAARGTPVTSAHVFVRVDVGGVAAETPCVPYADGVAQVHHLLHIDVRRETDAVCVAVIDADTQEAYGVVHLSLAALQTGVARRQRHTLYADAGTYDAAASGAVVVELSSAVLGHYYPVDDEYHARYASLLARLLPIWHPERLHRIDAIVATTDDLEGYIAAMTKGARRGLRKPIAQSPDGPLAALPHVTIAAVQAEALPPGAFYLSYIFAGKTTRGPSAAGPMARFHPNAATIPVAGAPPPSLFIQLAWYDHTATATVEIPTERLPLGGTASQWFTFRVAGARVLLTITCDGVGVPGGDAEPLCPSPAQVQKEAEAPLPIAAPAPEEGSLPQSPVAAVPEHDEEKAVPLVIEEDRDIIRASHRLDDDGCILVDELTQVVDDHERGTHSFSVSLVSVSALHRGDKAVTAKVACFAKLRLRQAKHRTKSVAGTGREIVFASRFEIDLEGPRFGDVLHVSVYGSDDGRDFRFGTCEVDITRVFKGRTREVRVPLVTGAGEPTAAIAGFVVLRIHCKTWGRPMPPAGEVVLTSGQLSRLRNLFVRHCPQKLHRLDFETDADEGFDYVLARAIRQYGPEPDTYELRLTVVSCNDVDAPSAVVDGGYNVLVHIGGELHETRIVASQNPEFNDVFTFTVAASLADPIIVIVMYAGREYGRCLLSLKNWPPNVPKRRVVGIVTQAESSNACIRGTITIDCVAACFGQTSLPSEEAERILRQRISSQLQRYAPTELHRVELMLGEHVCREDELMTSLIARYGCLPGDARLAVTVKEVRNLHRGGKLVLKADPYVKIKTAMEKHKTAVVKNVRDAFFDETFTFDLAHPEKDVVHLAVFGSEFGVDFKFGEVLIPLASLERGVSRQMTALVVQNAGTKNACLGGYVTVVLRSDNFGHTAAVDLNRESFWRNRLKNFFVRHCPEKLHAIEVICASQWDMDAYMHRLVQQYGPEPGAHTLKVTVLECRDIPDLRDNASVMVTLGIDTLTTRSVAPLESRIHVEETFTMAVTSPDEDLTFYAQRHEDKFEHGRAIVPLRSLVRGYPKSQWVYLVARAGTKEAAVVGSLHVTLLAVDFGLERSVPALPDADYTEGVLIARRKVECILTRAHPSELHRMDAILARYCGREDAAVADLQSLYGKGADVAPMTVRIRSLAATDKGTYTVACHVNGKPLLRTRAVKVRPGTEMFLSGATDQCIAHTELPPGHSGATVAFSVTGGPGGVGVAELSTEFCVRDFFNVRRLSVFTSAGRLVGTLTVDLRSVGFSGPSQDEGAVSRWVDIKRDVVSVLQHYEPARLASLDALLRSAADPTQLHGQLLRQYAPGTVITVLLEDVAIDTSAALHKEFRGGSWEVVARANGREGTTYPLIERAAPATPPAAAPADAAQRSVLILREDSQLLDNASMDRSLDSSMAEAGLTIASPQLSRRYAPHHRALRLDLSTLHPSSLSLTLVHTSTRAPAPVEAAQVVISLAPLFCGLMDTDIRHVLPLVGRAGSNGALAVTAIATLSLTYPLFQAAPRGVSLRRSSVGSTASGDAATERLVRNRAFVLHYYTRLVDYLSLHDATALVHCHADFFMAVLEDPDAFEWTCPEQLQTALARVGEPEGPHDEPPMVKV